MQGSSFVFSLMVFDFLFLALSKVGDLGSSVGELLDDELTTIKFMQLS